MVRKRIQISLSERQLKRLSRLSRELDISKSLLISKSLERFLDEQEYIYELDKSSSDLDDLFSGKWS